MVLLTTLPTIVTTPLVPAFSTNGLPTITSLTPLRQTSRSIFWPYHQRLYLRRHQSFRQTCPPYCQERIRLRPEHPDRRGVCNWFLRRQLLRLYVPRPTELNSPLPIWLRPFLHQVRIRQNCQHLTKIQLLFKKLANRARSDGGREDPWDNVAEASTNTTNSGKVTGAEVAQL